MLRNRPRVGQMYGGSPCLGNDTEATACNTQGCPQDCEWGSWSEWTSCSKDCGGGSIKRFREVVVEKDFGGDPCFGSDTQEAGCNFDVCAIHCEWNDWDLWSPCSKSCNGGTRSKSRSKKWDSSNGGMPCVGNATDMEKCNTEPCPVDCAFELWEPWGDCSTSCGLGSRFRTRVKKEESYGGADGSLWICGFRGFGMKMELQKKLARLLSPFSEMLQLVAFFGTSTLVQEHHVKTSCGRWVTVAIHRHLTVQSLPQVPPPLSKPQGGIKMQAFIVKRVQNQHLFGE